MSHTGAEVTSIPRQFGTSIGQIGTFKRQIGTCVFPLILRLILFVFLVMLMFVLYNIMVRIVIFGQK